MCVSWRRCTLGLLVMLLCVAPLLVAQIPTNEEPVPSVVYSMQLYNVEIYRVGSQIHIRHTIANNGGGSLVFRLANNRVFNVDITVQTEGGVALEGTPSLQIQRSQNTPVLYRDILLAPGEEFSFIEPLSTYVLIQQPGAYIVRGRFYPNLLSVDEATADSLVSRELLRLFVREARPAVPPNILTDISADASADITAPLVREDIAPDQVVNFLLNARINTQWEPFFLYLNLTSIYRSVPARDRIFTRLSAQNQLLEIEKFKQDLQRGSTDDGIVLRPNSYTVIETTYTNDVATVVADLQFGSSLRNAAERRYRYFLQRTAGTWEVYDYNVEILSSSRDAPQ